jgi:hypothetical protein
MKNKLENLVEQIEDNGCVEARVELEDCAPWYLSLTLGDEEPTN